jgi:DME family drug/metabolite transporter
MTAAGTSRLWILAAALLFSTGGAAIKGCTLSGFQIAGGRSLVAALALLLLVPEARRLGRRPVWIVASAYAATLVLFVAATKLTYAANAIYLQAAAPLYLLLLAPWLLHERWTRLDLARVVLITAGLLVLFLHEQAAVRTAPDPVLGDRLALLSGLSWALVVVGLRYLEQRGIPALAAVLAGNVLAAAGALAASGPWPGLLPRDVLILLYLGVVQIGLAYFALARGIRGLPAMQVALLLALEPVLNPVITYLVHGEAPGLAVIAGGALILAATLMVPRRPVPARAAAE